LQARWETVSATTPQRVLENQQERVDANGRENCEAMKRSVLEEGYEFQPQDFDPQLLAVD
jgi:hypothetical protein